MSADGVPLAVRAAGKTLAGRPVLSEVDFVCPPGTVTALLGPNGAGKTTTVALVAGLRRPDSGEVTVFGRPAGSPDARTLVAVVPQEIGFPDAVGVRRCLDFVEAQRGPSAFAPERDEVLAALGLGELQHRRTGALSGGQRRRLAIAAALMRAPGLLVLDEATTNLDESARRTTWRLVRDYCGRGGTALVTSHILADIESHADRVVALTGGRVVLNASMAEVHDRLGGSVVALRPGPADLDRVRRAADRSGLAQPLPPRDGRLRWRTRDPLALVELLASVAPDAADLGVSPMPLDEVLDAVTAESAPVPAADGNGAA